MQCHQNSDTPHLPGCFTHVAPQEVLAAPFLEHPPRAAWRARCWGMQRKATVPDFEALTVKRPQLRGTPCHVLPAPDAGALAAVWPQASHMNLSRKQHDLICVSQGLKGL